MAVDDGAGSFGLLAGGVLAGGLAGAVAAQAKAMSVEVESMQKFKTRVDELLTKLEGSQAAPKAFADGTLPSGDLGKGFHEADGLYGAYNTVHGELTNLSKALAGQIEALSIAVEGSRVGYENVDEDIKQRMRRLHADAEKRYDRKRDPEADEREGGHAQDPAGGPHTGDAGGSREGSF
ncbi:hypothetical protein [Streptomyces sp. NPDC101132]|uniref:hypothetical protein n=1 Tax=Streptomyces sp. NPDC101132 TaxID=3366110 RepID=UPI003802F26B